MMTADFCDSELHQRAFDIMAKMTPEDFGINMSITDFQDDMADRFNTRFQGLWSIDELLLHPREAQLSCDRVRQDIGNYLVEDQFILRSILTRRKNP